LGEYAFCLVEPDGEVFFGAEVNFAGLFEVSGVDYFDAEFFFEDGD
jgi:preprotein translocase subunit SecB